MSLIGKIALTSRHTKLNQGELRLSKGTHEFTTLCLNIGSLDVGIEVFMDRGAPHYAHKRIIAIFYAYRSADITYSL